MTDMASNIPHIKDPAILDGAAATSLKQNRYTYTFEYGVGIVGTDKGINYKSRNEDRVSIHPHQQFVAVVDGMGGYNDGHVAAQILAENLLRSPDDIQLAIKNTHAQLAAQNLDQNGACFVSAQLLFDETHSLVKLFRCGDCDALIVRPDGAIKYQTNDALKSIDTAFDAHYYNTRHFVENAVTGIHCPPTPKAEIIELEAGDCILLYSDGIGDNLHPTELANIVKESTSPDVAFETIANLTENRMRHYQVIESETATLSRSAENRTLTSDGFLLLPKPDNQALSILQVARSPKMTSDKTTASS